LRAAGELDEAEKAYQKVMELGNNGPGIRTNMSGIYYDRKNYSEAIHWAKKAIAKDPDYANAYAVLGDAHLARGEKIEAVRAYEKAAELNRAAWGWLPRTVPPLDVAPEPREVNQ
jgi:tetratricopeptide (TPR) repeat protein